MLIPECIFNAFGTTRPGESVKVVSVTFTTQPASGSHSCPGTVAQAGLRAQPQSTLVRWEGCERPVLHRCVPEEM